LPEAGPLRRHALPDARGERADSRPDHRHSHTEAHHPQPSRRAGLRRRTQVPCEKASPIVGGGNTMLGVIAKLTIKPGSNADFEAAMKALQAKVRADEPGNKLDALPT